MYCWIWPPVTLGKDIWVHSAGWRFVLLTQKPVYAWSNSFWTLEWSIKHAATPLFCDSILRTQGFKCALNRCHLKPHFYTNLSFQKLTKGTNNPNPQSGEYREREYYINNSELGLKIFAYLDKSRDLHQLCLKVWFLEPMNGINISHLCPYNYMSPPKTIFYIFR